MGSRGKEQSIIRHEPRSSPRTHVFRPVRAIPTRNGGVTRTCVHPAGIADGCKRARSDGDVENFLVADGSLSHVHNTVSLIRVDSQQCASRQPCFVENDQLPILPHLAESYPSPVSTEK